jgi:para-aminobenzoate synthetase/4-amino-4-deoxychorismate lyase
VLEAIFPCGSITGAPKIRAMEIIADGLEERRAASIPARSAALRRMASAAFNVAIRTLDPPGRRERRALMGLGSGIVADSRAGGRMARMPGEGSVCGDPDRSFDLIETMRFDPHDGIAELERHLARMKRSADALGFPSTGTMRAQRASGRDLPLREPRKLRLLLSRSGAVAIEVRPLPEDPGRAGGGGARAAAGRAGRLPPPPQDQRPRLLRRGARERRARSK